VHFIYYEKQRNRFHFAWSRPSTDRGQTEPDAMQEQSSAMFYSDRSIFGRTAAEDKPAFDS